MTRSLMSLLSKSLALAILAVAGLAAYLIVAAPITSGLIGQRERIDEQRTLLGRYTAAASQEGQAREVEKQARSALRAAMFLPGASDAVRLAELQTLTGRITQAEGVSVRSTRALPPRERDGVKFLGIEAQLNCTIEQLQRILHALESGQPALFVDALQVTAPRVIQEQDPTAATRLDVRIGVIGAVSTGKG